MSKQGEDRVRELTSLSHHLQALSEREKWELARKLHDELGGLLTAAKMDLSWLQSRLEGAAIQERLSQLGGVLDEAMSLKRRVVEELRPSLLDHFGFPTAARDYVESTCAKENLQAQVDVVHGCESMAKDTSIALFRIVQEGLANIIRHAHARTVKFELHGDEHNCVLTLSDDGRGFDAQSPEFRWSHGLWGMRQRAEGVGGHLEIKSSVGVGTTLSVAVPLSRQ
ncbi:MAG TPA: sensor histidine kinase [Steroidobacteraceae bacterium]